MRLNRWRVRVRMRACDRRWRVRVENGKMEGEGEGLRSEMEGEG